MAPLPAEEQGDQQRREAGETRRGGCRHRSDEGRHDPAPEQQRQPHAIAEEPKRPEYERAPGKSIRNEDRAFRVGRAVACFGRQMDSVDGHSSTSMSPYRLTPRAIPWWTVCVPPAEDPR